MSCGDHAQHVTLRTQVPALQPLVIVISGPSGVGKDAVIKQLQSTSPNLHFVVTATTRCCKCLRTVWYWFVFVSALHLMRSAGIHIARSLAGAAL